jgi:hypothetical protein
MGHAFISLLLNWFEELKERGASTVVNFRVFDYPSTAKLPRQQ